MNDSIFRLSFCSCVLSVLAHAVVSPRTFTVGTDSPRFLYDAGKSTQNRQAETDS